MTENSLQQQLVASKKYEEWFSLLPDYMVNEILNGGFALHHLLGRYYGYLDEELTIPSLWIHAKLPAEELPNINDIYKKIIHAFNSK